MTGKHREKTFELSSPPSLSDSDLILILHESLRLLFAENGHSRHRKSPVRPSGCTRRHTHFRFNTTIKRNKGQAMDGQAETNDRLAEAAAAAGSQIQN